MNLAELTKTLSEDDGKHELPVINVERIDYQVKSKTDLVPIYLPPPFTPATANEVLNNIYIGSTTEIFKYMQSKEPRLTELIHSLTNAFDSGMVYSFYMPSGLPRAITLEAYIILVDNFPLVSSYLRGRILLYSDNPKYYVLENGLLHNEHGYSIEFSDGRGLYHIRGEAVPKYLIANDRKDIDPKLIGEMKSQIAKEFFIRKVGMSKLYQNFLHSTGEASPHYQLLYLVVRARLEAWLLMRNPSTGEVHVEPVNPNCRSIQQALNWRAYQNINGRSIGDRYDYDYSRTYSVYQDWKPEIVT